MPAPRSRLDRAGRRKPAAYTARAACLGTRRSLAAGRLKLRTLANPCKHRSSRANNEESLLGLLTSAGTVGGAAAHDLAFPGMATGRRRNPPPRCSG